MAHGLGGLAGSERGESARLLARLVLVDPRKKTANVAELIKLRRGWRIISAEIEKCVVRCANCHRRRTAHQFGWYRWMPARRP
jgi:hypothetical protein